MKYDQNSDAALTRIERAKRAIDQLCGFYPPPQASDGRAFLAGLATILSEYHDDLIDLVANPSKGIAASHKFFPNLAELKTWLDERAAERDWNHRTVRAIDETLTRRITHHLPDSAVKPANYATRSVLKEIYGIRDVPAGWDVVDVCRAHARYGDSFHDEIEKALQTETNPPPMPSVFGRVMEQARAAMEARKK